MYNTSRSVTEKIHGPRAKLKGPTLLQSLLCLLCAKLVLLPQTELGPLGRCQSRLVQISSSAQQNPLSGQLPGELGQLDRLEIIHLQNNRSMDSMDMNFDHQTTIAFTIRCRQDLLGIGCSKAQTLSKAPCPILLSKSSSVMLNALAKSICFPSFHRIERSCLQQTTPTF